MPKTTCKLEAHDQPTLKAIGELQRMKLRYVLAAVERGDSEDKIRDDCADFDQACRDIASALDERQHTHARERTHDAH